MFVLSFKYSMQVKMNKENKSKKVIKITAIILVILIILGIALTEGIGNYFVNYAIARSGAGGDRKVSEETKIEIRLHLHHQQPRPACAYSDRRGRLFVL